jgi:hypothetical protein
VLVRKVRWIGATVLLLTGGAWWYWVYSLADKSGAIDGKSVWAICVKTIESTENGQVSLYFPVSDHVGPLNECNLSAALSGVGLRTLEPKPNGDFVFVAGQPANYLRAWRGGVGHDGWVESGEKKRCPKCGTIYLLVRRDKSGN